MRATLAFLMFLCGPLAALAPLGLAWAMPLLLVLLLIERRDVLWKARPFAALWFRLLLGFALLAGISLAWTSAPGSAAVQAGLMLPLVLLAAWGAIVISMRERAIDRRLTDAWSLGFGFGLALMLIELLFGQPLRALTGATVDDMSILRLNRSAVAFACFLWPTLFLLRAAGRSRWALAAAAATLGAVFLSHSQSAQLGLIIGGLALGLAQLRERFTRGVLAAAPLLLALIMVPLAQVLRWFDLTLAASLPLSFRQRIEIWDFTARRVGEALWFGHGLDASRRIDNGGEISAFQPAGSPILPLHPHNAFLQLWLELGLLGTGLAVAALAAAILGFGRMPASLRPFLLAASAAAIAMLAVAYGLWQGWWIGTLGLTVLLCAMAASRATTASTLTQEKKARPNARHRRFYR
jgi:O-antigen ligase